MIRTHVKTLFLAAALAFAPGALQAQDTTQQQPVAAAAATPDVGAETPASAAPAVTTSQSNPQAQDAFRMKPTPGIGMPQSGEMTFQKQFTPTGRYALWMHNAILLPLIVAISLLVLVLLLWVIARYRRAANPVPSRTSHNTVIEVIWTLVPVLILVAIAVPSIDLLAKQYRPAPADALTIKATGYQWYWGYSYPDNGISEQISNMLPEDQARTAGEPELLEVDNRLVIPVNTPIKLQTTGADVIHSFSVPAFWVKLDAIPGRINEKLFTVDRPGVYYGQCSELCGARHAFMPIAVEVLPKAQFAAWVASKGGYMKGQGPAEGDAAAAAAPPAAAVKDEAQNLTPQNNVEEGNQQPAPTNQAATSN